MAHILLKQIKKKIELPRTPSTIPTQTTLNASLFQCFFKIFQNIFLFIFPTVITSNTNTDPDVDDDSNNSKNNSKDELKLIEDEETKEQNIQHVDKIKIDKTRKSATPESFDKNNSTITLTKTIPSIPIPPTTTTTATSPRSNTTTTTDSSKPLHNKPTSTISTTLSTPSISTRYETKFRHIYLEPMKPECSMTNIPTPDVAGDYNLIHANNKFIVTSVQVKYLI